MGDSVERNRSIVSRASRAIHRISSSRDVSSRSSVDGSAMPSSAADTQSAAARTSLQAHRPHLSTSMSNAASTSNLTSPDDTNAAAARSPSAIQGASIEQSVRLFKIFEALRNGDTAAISKALSTSPDAKLEGTSILHLATQCAEVPVIEFILARQPEGINARDREGNTPLHTAAQLGRGPVVALLLSQPGINDASTNHQGQSPLDLARNPDIFQQLQLARSVYLDTVARRVHQLVAASDYSALEALLNDTRVKSTLDVNTPELATEAAVTEVSGTLLHEAARKKDLKLAQILLLNGADPFRRDRKGKLPQDVTKDERTRAILKKSPAAQAAQRNIQEKTILGDAVQTGSPQTDNGPTGKDSREMKGYLKKWTNYTSGYKLRWFVLEDGVLSYYKHQDDAGSACRGAINMRIAKLHMDPKDKLAFEIHGKSSVRYNLKANHQVEAKRWFWALNNAIQWAKDEAKEEQRRQEQETAAIRDARNQQLTKQRTREQAEHAPSTRSMLVPGTAVDLNAASAGPNTSQATSAYGDRPSSYAPSVPDDNSVKRLSQTITATIDGDIDDDEEYGDDASSRDLRPANRDAFSITAQSAKLQLDLLEQVATALQTERDTSPEMAISHPTVVQALTSYDTAVGNLKGLLMDLLRISRDHEAYWQYRLDREQNIRRLWEDSMAKVAREQEELENRFGESEEKRRRTKRALKEALESSIVDNSNKAANLEQDPGASFSSKGRRATIAELTNNQVSDEDLSDDDEFFDAVDSGEVEVVKTLPPSSPPLLSRDSLPDGKEAKEVGRDVTGPSNDHKELRAVKIAKSYRGYEDGPRKRLKLDADNRPKVGLWGILKSMIGKDMTRMTLPVSFNEPTSLLYRVVEDMEYTQLLDTAAERADSTERLVFVAGFAASEYASTIGRVAKPFNPLLGETYEYVRPDLGYRFFIEQVSHHPPVGAAFAESPNWDYYGESAVKSKFYGKSFEFNPLGTWFLHLRPASGGEELYTWKKVTSSVVGIITGNPTVDNYGPMEIKNWTTGEVCYLDFRARSWKASSAYQVTGRVVDAQGKTCWSIAGKWNERIYARHTPGYEETVVPPGGSGDKAGKDPAFLVWEAHERKQGVPFNLTTFAVTLNDLPERLQPLIAPTDSRLRPDQRAMEEGEYDFAATEKTRVEEAQRSRRRERETNGEEFAPRWFKKAKHPVTGEEYWDFSHEYWRVRDEVADGKKKWSEVPSIEQIF